MVMWLELGEGAVTHLVEEDEEVLIFQLLKQGANCLLRATAEALVQIPLAGSADTKVSQLAERVSVLVASMQKRCDEDKEELEQQMEKIHARLEARLGALERGEDGSLGREATWLREARGMVSAALTEAQAQWRQEFAQLKGEQQQQLELLEDLAGVSRHSGTRLEKVERGLAAHERTIRRAEEHLKALTHHGPQYSQLEGALLNLERQVNEQQVAVEVQVARLQVECDGLRRRSEAIAHTREELVEAVEERLARATVSEPRAAPRDDSRLLQRCDDLDARLAAQKVHVEAHEQRFKSFAERLEAVQMELFDQLRSFGVQRREELLQEVDGQLRVLRERMDTLSELLDEIMLRQAVEGRKGHFVRPLPRLHEEL
ncbi:unnamed protein product [Durusdinium trenchii]|uniref:Uncharacterized protein n=1 Tax=Durusdinium trenchii TaxID=1381693 RepID=A0ABP0S288_9DINO